MVKVPCHVSPYDGTEGMLPSVVLHCPYEGSSPKTFGPEGVNSILELIFTELAARRIRIFRFEVPS